MELDEPGIRSGAALEALNAELGAAPDAQGFFLAGHWADQLSLAVSAGQPALLGQLSHPDPAVRRILAVVLAYTDALPDDIVALCEHDLDAPVRLGLLALGRYTDAPQVRDICATARQANRSRRLGRRWACSCRRSRKPMTR
ncbi:hypothetical protein OG528_38485 [Streptomyces platensis]|uniref:hypothetical protein n=1 Tax=Streptomyces platensis TaxID=58346 RepID=UPI0030DE315C